MDQPQQPQPPESGPQSDARAWAAASSAGSMLMGGLLLGWAFDEWQNTSPWGAAVGVVVGFGGCLSVLIRLAMRGSK